jgi:hypothetical protein
MAVEEFAVPPNEPITGNAYVMIAVLATDCGDEEPSVSVAVTVKLYEVCGVSPVIGVVVVVSPDFKIVPLGDAYTL